MGLHSAIKPYLANTAKHALLDELPQGTSPLSPTLCVVDFMWLLFRFSGSTGFDLLHFYLRQLFEVYDAGIFRVAILTDDALRVPEQKRAEQNRRRKKRPRPDGAAAIDLAIDDDALPSDFTAALMVDGFRDRMMLYLAEGVRKLLKSPRYDDLAKRLVVRRRLPADTRLIACLNIGSCPCQTWTWRDGRGWNCSEVTIVSPYHGEADLATIDVIRFFLRVDEERGRATNGVVVRTIDSDSIPILLLLRRRMSSSVPLYLWLPACGAGAASGRRSTYVDTPSTEPSVVAIAKRVVPSGGVFVPAARVATGSVASRLWNYENRVLFRIDAMYNDEDSLRFAVLCVIMGTDFNAKLVPRASAATISKALSRRDVASVRNCFESAKQLASVCNALSGIDVTTKVPMKEFVNASWTLRYWSGLVGRATE
ncbi:hypothetical protein CYMTET_3876 [Cymbomonas tetramitiformis]|uniref:Uncharacterized protein n=1 Tax=Cymbomonas tetramitiformis TaxID=36881 RepID=A0AAE0H2G7_9CHLO|nr:hypothetical protein CYMTET_3876 [Cymbomonas tetramitiformis]|eukprot:gene28152-34855_t